MGVKGSKKTIVCSMFLFNTENTEGTELSKPFFCTNYHVIDHELS